MKTITDTEVKQKGLGALVEALGEVDAERFITLVNREPFDYTHWQKKLFAGMDVRELSKNAMKLQNQQSGNQK
jgi:hypothetical protein